MDSEELEKGERGVEKLFINIFLLCYSLKIKLYSLFFFSLLLVKQYMNIVYNIKKAASIKTIQHQFNAGYSTFKE